MWGYILGTVVVILIHPSYCGIDNTDYQLTFKTCDVPGADTNATAYLTLQGESGADGTEVEIPGVVERFSRGGTDVINVTVEFTGPICSILLRRGKAGEGQGWKLEWVDIQDVEGHVTFVINDCYLDDDWVAETNQQYSRDDPVNGDWGAWGPWQQKDERLKCLRHRYRACDCPKPICGGLPCSGNSSEMACVDSLAVVSKVSVSFAACMLPTLLGLLLPILSLAFLVIIFFWLNRPVQPKRKKIKRGDIEGPEVPAEELRPLSPEGTEVERPRLEDPKPEGPRPEVSTSEVSGAEGHSLEDITAAAEGAAEHARTLVETPIEITPTRNTDI